MAENNENRTGEPCPEISEGKIDVLQPVTVEDPGLQLKIFDLNTSVLRIEDAIKQIKEVMINTQQGAGVAGGLPQGAKPTFILRGPDIDALKYFIESQGFSANIVIQAY